MTAARGDVFDEQPMPTLDSEALNFPAASESFASVRNLTRHDLEPPFVSGVVASYDETGTQQPAAPPKPARQRAPHAASLLRWSNSAEHLLSHGLT